MNDWLTWFLFGIGVEYDSESLGSSPGDAHLSPAEQFVGDGPDALFRGVRARANYITTSFDMVRLTFQLISGAEFLALGHKASSLGFGRFFVGRLDGGRHIDAESGAQINFMVLLLHNNRPQGFAYYGVIRID